MSQLFASPDEPRPQDDAPRGAVRTDAAVEHHAVSPDSRPQTPAPDVAPASGDQVFEAPPRNPESTTEYVVPGAPARPSRPVPPRRGVGAAIAVTSLLLGVGGGVGGAAAWQAWGPEDSASPAQVAALPVPATSDSGQPATGSVAAVAQAALPSVVQIETRSASGGSTGSGMVIRSDGYVLTNNHVVEGANGTVQVMFSDGQVEDATIVGTSADYDLAVLQVARTNITPLVLGDSDAMVVGDPVVAVGSPLGLESTVTTGIVSALDRPVTTGRGGTPAYMAAIQTDAAINPGNSGGPLLNMSGEVIGINSAIAALPGATQATGAGSVGLGFSIPSNQARRVAEELIATGKAAVPAIGAQLDSTYAGRGVRVADSTQTGGNPGVVAGSPADKAGIVEGDIIVAIEGELVADSETAIVKIRTHAPGDEVTFTLERDGKDVDVNVTLGALGDLNYGDTTSGNGSNGSQ
ncbi:MAG: trypsin-like peptidase domain-containing protein [Demequina sp.]|uniref:S1C family serine protease n=1 Tax=Demequina sp. TaxID=2050685 RepID=UPI00198EA000|nr:trypsin-like peptidase domain-containing protein [Demequina sp.]MBC7298219.1 trypsin-like peptidase domain-containing protein [Demequina sp.]